jgi:F-type H+-transporting ATPase subunit alpha
MPVEEQVAVLWAIQNGHMDDVPVDRIKELQAKLQEFLTTRKRKLLDAIRTAGAISKELNDELATTLVEFKSTWR